MGARACSIIRDPPQNTTKNPGTSVTVSFRIYNCGDESGNFHCFIRKNNVICDKQENFSLSPNANSNILECDFTMPNSSVTIKYTGGHSEGSTWIDDYEKTITISPAPCATTCETSCQTACKAGCQTACDASCQTACKASCQTACKASCQTACQASCQTACQLGCETAGEVPTTCDQLVKVVDPALNPIEGATVLIDMGTYSILCEKPDKSGWGTDADGFCYLRNLDINTLYTACASKADYEHYGDDGCKLFTACTTPIAVILTLHKLIKKDTVICDFDILDADEKVVTDLYAGVQYWVRAWLCKVEGGGCAEILKGCDSGCEIPSEDLKLFLFGQAASVATGTTNENGYTAFAWIPSEDIGNKEGLDNSVRVEFAGSTGYNSSETTWKTVTVKLLPYTINVTVNDQDGNPLEGAYVDINQWVDPISRNEKKCADSDVAVFVGECKEEEWKGDGYNVVTASVGDDKGKVSIGLPKEYPAPIVPTPIHGWTIRVGKTGYLNKDVNGHEDWTDEQVVKGADTHNLVFTLTFITVEDKFIVSTIGFKEGDFVQCQRAYAWSKCLVTVPFSIPVFKAPDAYPDGKVEFTTADGLTEGETYGIGPRIAGAIVPTGPSWCGEFKGIRKIEIPRYGILGSVCELLGIGAASDECRRFWEEMLDPVYCANCITGVLKGEDIHGAEYHPGKFELAMFPVVVVCSLLPMVPGAKITKFLGRLFKKAAPAAKHGDDVLAVRKYFEDEYLDIYRIQTRGDDARLTNWAKAIEKGDIDGPDGARAWMRKILDDPLVLDADAVGYFDSMLDELTKQIDSIDPKHVDEIADLRARVIEAANACMDDVTDFTKVYDEKYTEFIDVARRGSEDTRVTTFVRATDNVCSPGSGCKFYMMAAKDKLHVGRAVLDMPEYTKFLYKHGATTPAHESFADSLRFLAVSDEGDILSLKTIMEADDWTAFRGIKRKFDWRYDGQINFFDNERLRILGQWSAERVDDIMGTSGFRDELTRMFGDLIKNPTEAKKVIDTQTVKMVGLGAAQEPSKAADFFVKAHAIATPSTVYPDSLAGILVSGNVAADLKYLGDIERSRKWWSTYAKAAKDYPNVAEYLKNNKALVIEAFAKGDLSKLDEFSELISRGDTTGAHRLLNGAISGTPLGSINRTYNVVRDTEKVLDDVVPPAPLPTRAALQETLDETCENVYMLLAKTPADMKRVVTGAELDSIRQIFQRGARRIIDRTSGGLKKLRRKRPDLAATEGERYSYTMRNGKIVSETYSKPPKEVRNFFWRHWKAIGGIATAAVIMVPWWAVDNAVFLVYMGREGGWIDKLWGNRWHDAHWKIVDANKKMELDPCVKSHQELYVGALEEMYELLKVDPVLPETAKSLSYNYMVQWGFTPSQPSVTFKEQCYQQFNSDNERYFQLVQHCPSPVEPSFGFAVTEMPEMFPAVTSIIEDADTLYVIPPDEDPSGNEFYWEHGNPILVRLAGINSPEGPNYYYSCTEEKKKFLVRRLLTPGEECISEELWTVDSVFYAQANAWLASQLPEDTHVTLRSDKDRQWLTKYKKIRFLAAVYKGTTNIDVEELKEGYAVLFIVDKNKQVWDIATDKLKTKYANAEYVAKLKKTRIWDPKWAKPCPATEVWYNITSGPVRVNEEATFAGDVLGCDTSEIIDWTWTGFPDGVVRTGREVTYKFSEKWSGKIYLEICTGALKFFRTFTVAEKHPNRKSPCIPFGNVNGDPDDYVNDIDAALVQRYLEKGWDDVKSEVATGINETEFKKRADVGGDGEVTQDDVNKIYEFYEGPSVRNSFPVCPGECPTPSVDFSFLPTSPIVGQKVLFTCKSSGGDSYSIVKRKWDFGDGTGDEDNHGLVTHTYSKAEKYDVYLTVTNDCETGESKIKKKTITVSEKPIPPPAKGNLTIMAFKTSDFIIPLSVANFFVDDLDKAGGYAVTVKDLSVGSHKVEIVEKTGKYMTCYADLPDECYTEGCVFDVNVVEDKTVTVKVCLAHTCLFLPSEATVYVRHEDEVVYEKIPHSYTLPFGVYYAKFTEPGYVTHEAVIRITDTGIVIKNVIEGRVTAKGYIVTAYREPLPIAEDNTDVTIGPD